jgi:general secretion pathway protein B
MSFILDALKKSESDRQRQSGPSLFEVKVAPPRRSLPLWAVAIAVLLGINVVVVSWMLLRRTPTGGQQRPAASVATAVPAAPAAAAPAVGRTPVGTEAPAPTPRAANATPAAGNADTQPSAHPVPPGASPAAIAGGGARDSTPAAATPDASDQAGGAPPAGGNASDYAPAVESAAASGAAAQGNGDGLPLYQQIVTSAGLPALHLDLHVFAESPKDRFVMINMHRLGEGDSLPSGVRVEAIRPDGVVLSYQGTRFLLPRD